MPQYLSRSLDLTRLEGEGATIAVTDASSRILWVNAAWKQFAAAHGKSQSETERVVGTSYLGSISGWQRDFYASQFERALGTGKPFEQTYSCSTSTEVHEYRMRLIPIDRAYVVTEHTFVRASGVPAAWEPVDSVVETLFRNRSGHVSQCGNCRRVRRVDGIWQWVGSWVERSPPVTSHVVCVLCSRYYYGILPPQAAESP